MTELRDARFKQALEAAPDADERPMPSVANSIRTAARNVIPAVVPREAPISWWLRLWQRTGQPRSPWGAAFATVLVAVLVTVMWVREPIPDARPIAIPASPVAPAADAPLAEAPKPAPPVAAALEKKSITTQPQTQSPAPAPKPALTPAPSPVAPPQSATRQESETRRLDTAKDESHPVWPTPAPAIATAVAPAPAAPAAPVAAMAPAPAPAPMAAAPQAKSVTMPEQRAQIAKQNELSKALVAPQPSADLAGASQRSAARSAAPAALADSMAPSAKAAADMSGPESWDALLVQTGGHAVKLDRDQGRKLFALMQRLQSSLSTEQDAGQSGPATAPDLLIKVQAQEQVIATFTLSGKLARWNRPGRVQLSATLSDAQIAQLMQAVRDCLEPAANGG